LKIKVDENIGRSGVDLLRQAGHDVLTVRDQSLSGAPDEVVFQVCASERRTLVTLDRVVEAGRVRVHLERDAE